MPKKEKSKYSISLHKQAYNKLKKMLQPGTSKRALKKNSNYTGTTFDNTIFSYKTFRTYKQQIEKFIDWVEENYPDCTTLKKAKNYIKEYHFYCEEKGYSAWTMNTAAMALNKLYSLHPGDYYYYDPPKRERAEVTRSRGPKKRDKHFSEANHTEYINFCRGVGCRKEGAENLKGTDLYTRQDIQDMYDRLDDIKSPILRENTKNLLEDALLFPDMDYYVYLKEKGGRERYAPIIGPDKEKIIQRFKDTLPGKKIWEYVPEGADTHSYRSDYAVRIYKHYARNIEDIPYDKVNKGTGRRYQSQVYHCRKDEHKKLDKVACHYSAKSLGHNRDEIVATSYLRGI